MNIENLVGKHKLSGIDYETRTSSNLFDNEDDSQYVLFILDGVEYVAQEDLDDGYRSYCEDIRIVDNQVKNIFPPIDVNCILSEDFGEDVLEIIDEITGDPILIVGTDYSEDYYPCCIMSYRPGICVQTNRIVILTKGRK